MNIHIIESDVSFQDQLMLIKKELEYAFPHGINYIPITNDAHEIIEKFDYVETDDLLLFDIEKDDNKYAGLEMASIIRRYFPHINIIFLTSSSDCMTDSFQYKVSALGMIDKTLTIEEIVKEIIDCIIFVESQNKDKHEEKLFYFENKHSVYSIKKKEICYFETSPTKHKIKLVSKYKIIEFKSTLAEIEQKDESFIRIHQAFVVNWDNVIGIDKKNKLILLADGHTCPISRTYYKIMTCKFFAKD